MAGHRKVTEGLYRTQLGGKIIQINPMEDWVMLVAPPNGRPLQASQMVRQVPSL